MPSMIPTLVAVAQPTDRQLGLLALFALGIPVSFAILWVVSALTQRRTRLQQGEYGPVKWLFVFASGAKPDILRECPEEEPKFVGLGSAVLVTSTMAAVSRTIALKIATGLSWCAIWPIRVLYGGIVFLLDRFLVSQQLNPYRFDRDQLPDWWRNDMDPRFTAGNSGRRWRRLRNVGRVPAVLLAALPRLLLAAVIGVLIAEPVVLSVFQPEVDDKIASIQREIRDRDVAEINAYYDAEIERLGGRIRRGPLYPGSEDAASLKAGGVAGVFTPKDFDIVAIMGEITDLVEAARS